MTVAPEKGIAAQELSDRKPPDTGYEPYPEYKDSGIDWLGEVPASWDIKRSDALLDKHRRPPSSAGAARAV